MRLIDIVAFGVEFLAAVVDFVHKRIIEERRFGRVVEVVLRYIHIKTGVARLNQAVNVNIPRRNVNRLACLPRRAAFIRPIAGFIFSFFAREQCITIRVELKCFIPANFRAQFLCLVSVGVFGIVSDVDYAFGVALRNAVLSPHFYIHCIDSCARADFDTAILVVDKRLADGVCHVADYVNVI